MAKTFGIQSICLAKDKQPRHSNSPGFHPRLFKVEALQASWILNGKEWSVGREAMGVELPLNFPRTWGGGNWTEPAWAKGGGGFQFLGLLVTFGLSQK
ncbi:hypothetical protein [Rhodonellum ikkaensis]|uniref:hypothetical protein n=1 Tax=Rhodonellum ikkaensis TaxID=336829 RepID=UPI001587D08A|nr:hypothetical protein [Rhodonellum ikkaensis]